MSETSLIPIETKKKIEEALEFFYSLKKVKFTNKNEYDNGNEVLKSLKTFINTIENDRKTLVKPINDDLDKINGPCNNVIRKLKEAEKVFKNGLKEWYIKDKNERDERQKILDAEIEEKRRKEMEKARKEQEKADAYREKGRNEMADKAEARAATAETIASNIVAPIIQNTAKLSGTSFTKKFYAKIIDHKKAVTACVANDILLQYVSIDIRALEKLANAQKGMLTIDGIQFFEDFQVGIKLK